MGTFDEAVARRTAVGQALGETAEGVVGGIDLPDVPTAAELAADPEFTGAFVSASVIADRPTGVAATDRAMLLEAIGDTPVGGKLYLPNATDGTWYAIDQPLVIDKHMSVEGESLQETFLPITGGLGATNKPSPPYFAGCVLKQVTAGENVIELTGAAKSVNLRNLGLIFDSAIWNDDTGHGIWAVPDQMYGDGHDSGVMGFRWENICAYGVDGDHYACYMVNPIMGTIDHTHFYGGGGYWIECDSHYTNYGNMVVSDPYVETFNAGTAGGFVLASRTTTFPGLLNLITWIRPQCNSTGDAATQGTQPLWDSLGGANPPRSISVIDPNMEPLSGSTCPIDFGGINNGTTVHNGGLLAVAPVGGTPRESGYLRYTSSGTFTVPKGITQLRVRCVAGGGGGGGGGSSSAIANQAGGGGGGAGAVVDGIISVTPGATENLTVGAGGTGGAGGASGGNAGAAGTQGGNSSFAGTGIVAVGGGGGSASSANSASGGLGGWFARSGATNTTTTPGFGANGGSTAGQGSVFIPPGVAGGGGGGGSTASNGGGGGSALTGNFPRGTGASGGASGASGTGTGVAGTDATASGSGGGGGGGGANGSAGGDGGDGAPGFVEIWW